MTSTLLDSYQTYFRDLMPILRDMSARGIPIDNSRREELRQLIERDDQRITQEIQPLVPPEVLSTKHAKGGYKVPPILECEDCGWKGRTDHLCPIDGEITQVDYRKLAEEDGLVLRDVVIGEGEKCRCSKRVRMSGECVTCAGTGIMPAGMVERRWTALKEFNPNSWQQVRRLIKALGHTVPKHAKRTTESGEAAETTEVKELERLWAKTKHSVYPLLIEKRQLTKLMGVYVDGWAPSSKDGRIHTTYTFQTATWQLSSRSPNLQNGLKRGRTPAQKERVIAFNRMQRALPGHTLVSLDYKSFHAQTTACEAGLPDYLRLAKIDIHSFVASHILKLPERFELIKWSDGDLRGFFKELKRRPGFGDIRSKSKAASLGIGFGMRAKKLYMTYREDFDSQREAESIWNMIMIDLFPGLLKWQEMIKHKAAEEKRLVSRFGAIRHFFDVERWDRRSQKWAGGDQAEAAIAFLPAANAFGMIRYAMLRLRERGLDAKYELINTVHDSLTLHPLQHEAEQAVGEYRPIMEAPCPLMVYPGVTSDEGLSVEVEASIGEDMSLCK